MTRGWRLDAADPARLFDPVGRRKYLCAPEARLFLAAARQADPRTRTFALLLAYTGCRISEGLALTPASLDRSGGQIVIRTLKRRRLCYRVVPIPSALMDELTLLASGCRDDQRLWSCCRQTAWRRIKRLMKNSQIAGPQATAKGLRHRFGVLAAEHVPLALAQRWMGHAKPQTTAIYQQVVGEEERRLAQRLWDASERPDL